MRIITLVTTVSLFVAATYSQSSGTTTTPYVPTGTPVSGNYNGRLRPQVHFSPPQGFMNDPNGMFRDEDGLWHLYYQYNPTATVAGNQHWGHATSTDLYHWENQPIALFPPNPTTYVFSGSAVVDSNNTSGFFPNQTNGVVAVYTLSGTVQDQNIAYSFDGGYTFTPYLSNPVIDINSTQFRDPKVIWHAPTSKWVMVISYASEFTIGVYTSPNLREWTHASNFSHAGLLGLQYECPNLVEMPMYASQGDPKPSTTMHVLAISINPGAPLGGSITQYFPGHFNGTHFTAVDGATRLTDFAKDNYAGQFFYGIPGHEPQVFIGWASNWQYSEVVPTGYLEGWRSSMSLPRITYLANTTRTGYDLITKPYPMDSILIDPPLAHNPSLGNGTVLVDLSSDILHSNAFYFDINITSINTSAPAGVINVTLVSSASGETISLGQLPLGSDLFFNRGNTYGFDNVFYTDKFSVTNLIDPSQGPTTDYRLEGVFDRSLFEVFCNGGKQAGTISVFPEQTMDTLIIKTSDMNDAVGVSVEVRGLMSAWKQFENADGVVSGNATTQAVRRDRIGHLGP